MSPFKSRSTIITLVCIAAFVAFSFQVMASGYFDAGFGAAGLLFLTNVVKHALDHQSRADNQIYKADAHQMGGMDVAKQKDEPK